MNTFISDTKSHSSTTDVKPLQERYITSKIFAGSFSELMHPPTGQIAFLDGLRSVAVLLVISYHASGVFARAHGSNFYSRLPFVANGWMGVDLFFVLSGFFIGCQLWKEVRDQGTVSVGRFMLRRGFRIWPLYFFVYLCVLTYRICAGHDAGFEYGWTDLLFISNYHDRGLILGGWSLCTEEQFYIVTPIALFFLAPFIASIRHCRPWLLGTLLFLPVFRALLWIHSTGHLFQHDPKLFTGMFYESSVTHCDGLIMGLIIANFWVTREKLPFKYASPTVLIGAASTVMILLYSLQKEVTDFFTLALLFGSLVWFGLHNKARFFDSRIFYWISRLSFGMYLNHQYFCPWVVNTLFSGFPSAAKVPVLLNLIEVLLVTILSAAIALITFCLVEHPFLEMRKIVLRTNH